MKRKDFIATTAKWAAAVSLRKYKAVFIAPPWRSYDVYQPDIQTYTITHLQSHDATIAWFEDRWFALWDDGTEMTGQRIWQSSSFDLVTWTPPIECFTSPAGSTNPVNIEADKTLFQPSLVVANSQLWCFWMNNTAGDLYYAQLSNAAGRWNNRKLFGANGAQYPLPVIDGYTWKLFAGTNGVVMDNGRVLVPVTLQRNDHLPFFEQFKTDAVIYTDDQGEHWKCSNGTKINDTNQWEATIWQPAPGVVNMLSRNNRNRVPLVPGQNLKSSYSLDNGSTWHSPEELIPLEAAMSRVHVLRYGVRNIIAHNDWAVTSSNLRDNRRNLSLSFNRGTGFNFTPGISFTAADTTHLTDYPQIAINGDVAAIIYTWEADNTPASRQTRVAKISPLPADDKYYLFPRAPRGSVKTEVTDGKRVLKFLDDHSSAGLDLDANNASEGFIHIRFRFKILSGDAQTLLSIDEPDVHLGVRDKKVVLRNGSQEGTEIICGSHNDWTAIELITGKGQTRVSVNNCTFVTGNFSPNGPIRAFFGRNKYENLNRQTGAAFLVEVGSVQTLVELTNK